MPFYLEPRDVVPDLGDVTSALIVPCRFCPAASMAVRNNEPYIEFPRRAFKTHAYERLLASTTQNLESKGIKTAIFKSRLLHQFVICMWTSRRRKKLGERAKQHEAIVVMGCEAAVETVRNAVKSTGCRVLPGMQSQGIMSIQPRFSFPCNITLELEQVTPYVHAEPSCS